MHAVSDEPLARQTTGAGSAYRGIFERAAIDAPFLWSLRSLAVDQPHYTLADLAELEQRLDTQLDLLMSSLELGWEVCLAALDNKQAGEAFVATVVAMRMRDVKNIQIAIEAGVSEPAMFKGAVSALGWLPAPLVQPWIERFLRGKDLRHKYLGIVACSVRRDDPGEALNDILSRSDCRQHVPLYTRALRLVGELRRQDAMPILQANIKSEDPHCVFWSSWSAVLLGQRGAVNHLKSFVLHPGALQRRAIDIAFRVLPVDQGREWISLMAKDPANARAVIQATGELGDPHAVNWLIAKMSEPSLARAAAEAFTFITGIDLEQQALIAPPPGALPGPNDDPADENVRLDEDEHLPWPDVDKVQSVWRTQGQQFLVGRRYFLGKTPTPDWLKHILLHGSQRQRHAAALELALVDANTRLLNTRAKATP